MSTATSFACVTANPFYIQVTGTGQNVDGLYGQVLVDSQDAGYHDISGFTADTIAASIFVIDPDTGYLLFPAEGRTAYFYDATTVSSEIIFLLPTDPTYGVYNPIRCSLSDNALACTPAENNTPLILSYDIGNCFGMGVEAYLTISYTDFQQYNSPSNCDETYDATFNAIYITDL